MKTSYENYNFKKNLPKVKLTICEYLKFKCFDIEFAYKLV